MSPMSTDCSELKRHASKGGCIKYDSYECINRPVKIMIIYFKTISIVDLNIFQAYPGSTRNYFLRKNDMVIRDVPNIFF